MTLREYRQDDIAQWCERAFGVEEARSIPQRGIRLLEEAAEAAQAAGVSQADAMKVVAYVFSRPPGKLEQELGGVGITVLALAAAAGIHADDAEYAEAQRVLSKPIEHFRQRNQAKNDAGLTATREV